MKPDLTNFPAELKAERVWCLWRYEIKDKGEPTKVPYRDLVTPARPQQHYGRHWMLRHRWPRVD